MVCSPERSRNCPEVTQQIRCWLRVLEVVDLERGVMGFSQAPIH